MKARFAAINSLMTLTKGQGETRKLCTHIPLIFFPALLTGPLLDMSISISSHYYGGYIYFSGDTPFVIL